MLLHKNTRESLGISLKGNIVIIDEAHNLVEAINSIYSNTVTLAQVNAALLGSAVLTPFSCCRRNHS